MIARRLSSGASSGRAAQGEVLERAGGIGGDELGEAGPPLGRAPPRCLLRHGAGGGEPQHRDLAEVGGALDVLLGAGIGAGAHAGPRLATQFGDGPPIGMGLALGVGDQAQHGAQRIVIAVAGEGVHHLLAEHSGRTMKIGARQVDLMTHDLGEQMQCQTHRDQVVEIVAVERRADDFRGGGVSRGGLVPRGSSSPLGDRGGHQGFLEQSGGGGLDVILTYNPTCVKGSSINRHYQQEYGHGGKLVRLRAR